MWQKIMRWEVQYPEPKGIKPFDNYDLIACLGFACVYTFCIMSFDIILFFIIELLWAWYVKRRIES